MGAAVRASGAPAGDRPYLPAALGLYASAGYGRIPVYGEYVDNPYSVCFEKRLPVLA